MTLRSSLSHARRRSDTPQCSAKRSIGPDTPTGVEPLVSASVVGSARRDEKDEEGELTLGSLLGLTLSEDVTECDKKSGAAPMSRSQATPPSASSPLASRKRRRLTQYRLDFGQRSGSSLATECPHCHMLYSAHEEDLALHRQWCDQLQPSASREAERDHAAAMLEQAAQPAKHKISKPLVHKWIYPSLTAIDNGEPPLPAAAIMPVPVALSLHVLRCVDAKGLWKHFPQVAAALEAVCGDCSAFFPTDLRLSRCAAAASETVVVCAVLPGRGLVAALSGQAHTRLQEPLFEWSAATSKVILRRPQTLGDVQHVWCLPSVAWPKRSTYDATASPLTPSSSSAKLGNRGSALKRTKTQVEDEAVLRHRRATFFEPRPTPRARSQDESIAFVHEEQRQCLRGLLHCWRHQVIYGTSLHLQRDVSYEENLFLCNGSESELGRCLKQAVCGADAGGVAWEPCLHTLVEEEAEYDDTSLLVMTENEQHDGLEDEQ